MELLLSILKLLWGRAARNLRRRRGLLTGWPFAMMSEGPAGVLRRRPVPLKTSIPPYQYSPLAAFSWPAGDFGAAQLGTSAVDEGW